MKFIYLDKQGNSIKENGNDYIISTIEHDFKELFKRSLLVINDTIMFDEIDTSTNSLIVRNPTLLLKNNSTPITMGLIVFDYEIIKTKLTKANVKDADNLYNSLEYIFPKNISTTAVLCLGGSLLHGNSLKNTTEGYSIKLINNQFKEKVLNSTDHIKVPSLDVSLDSNEFIKEMFDLENTFMINIKHPNTLLFLRDKISSSIPGSFMYNMSQDNPVLVNSLGFPVVYRLENREESKIIIPMDHTNTVTYSADLDTIDINEVNMDSQVSIDHENSVYRLTLL